MSTARWGTGASNSGQSGYDFQTSTTPLTVQTDGTAFSLGDFTHWNFPIYPPSLNSIDLDIRLGNIFTLATTFSIDHNETPNNTSNPNDIVTILNPVVDQQFNYLGGNYYFNLFGLSQDGGETLSSTFSTIEGQVNTASLYARITEVPIGAPVPEPATMLLFGTGLIGLIGYSRKRGQKS